MQPKKKINDSHFDKPIKEAFNSKSHNREDVVSRKELNKRLIGQYADTINRLKERLENEPDQFRREVLENEIIDQQAEFEEFLGKFSPKELKEYLESEEENISN